MSNGNWYDAVYSGENDGSNPFATERDSRTRGLREHIAADGSILTFKRREPLPGFDAVVAAISQPGAMK